MKQALIARLSFLTSILLLLISSAEAQGIDWTKDTITETAAIAGRYRLSNDLNAAGRKSTKYVEMNVSKLKEVVDACAANGITNIKFWLTSIRREDVAQYALRNPGLTEAEKNELIGRQIIVIKVPRSIFKNNIQQSSGFIPGISPLMISLMLYGFTPFDTQGIGDTYLSFGAICPPPDNCAD